MGHSIRNSILEGFGSSATAIHIDGTGIHNETNSLAIDSCYFEANEYRTIYINDSSSYPTHQVSIRNSNFVQWDPVKENVYVGAYGWVTFDSCNGTITGYNSLNVTSGANSAVTFINCEGYLHDGVGKKTVIEPTLFQSPANVGFGIAPITAARLYSYIIDPVAAGGESYGIFSNVIQTTANSNLNQGVRSTIETTHTSGTINNLVGTMSISRANGASGTTAAAIALWARVDAYNSSTITNGYGIYIADGYLLTSGTITNLYGLYITNQTSGGTLNYSIYTGTAPSYFGGNVEIAGGLKAGNASTDLIGFYGATAVDQPAAVADATDAASAITQLNLLLARMRELGLIAT
jgi:hypothetical protein